VVFTRYASTGFICGLYRASIFFSIWFIEVSLSEFYKLDQPNVLHGLPEDGERSTEPEARRAAEP
jgi:hypothetical protein